MPSHQLEAKDSRFLNERLKMIFLEEQLFTARLPPDIL